MGMVGERLSRIDKSTEANISRRLLAVGRTARAELKYCRPGEEMRCVRRDVGSRRLRVPSTTAARGTPGPLHSIARGKFAVVDSLSRDECSRSRDRDVLQLRIP